MSLACCTMAYLYLQKIVILHQGELKMTTTRCFVKTVFHPNAYFNEFEPISRQEVLR